MGFHPDWIAVAQDKGLIAAPAPSLACSEREFQAAVIALAKRYGWITHHHHDSRRSSPGWPDLVLIRGGKLIVAELKTETGKVAQEQTVWLAALQSCGVDARIWRPSMWSSIVDTLDG